MLIIACVGVIRISMCVLHIDPAFKHIESRLTILVRHQMHSKHVPIEINTHTLHA